MVDDIAYVYIFHICDFIHALGFICIYVCYPACYWQPKVLMEEISLFMSICWPLSRTCIPYFGKRGVTRPNIIDITIYHVNIEETKLEILIFSLVTLLMIRLTLRFWSKLQDPRCLEEYQRRASSFNESHYGWSTSGRSIIIDIIIHDVNIEEIKLETLVLTLSLFSWSS